MNAHDRISGDQVVSQKICRDTKILNVTALKRADVLAHFKDISADTIDRYLKKAAAVGDLIPGKEGRAIAYRKPAEPDSPQFTKLAKEKLCAHSLHAISGAF